MEDVQILDFTQWCSKPARSTYAAEELHEVRSRRLQEAESEVQELREKMARGVSCTTNQDKYGAGSMGKGMAKDMRGVGIVMGKDVRRGTTNQDEYGAGGMGMEDVQVLDVTQRCSKPARITTIKNTR